MPLSTITDKLDSFGVEYVIDNYQAPLYNDPNGELISTLVGVYNTIAGRNEKPIAIGGGTYARALKCGCAFGPELPDVESTIHQANEYVTFDCIRFMSDVYYTALKALACPANTETACEEKRGVKLGTVRINVGGEEKKGSAVMKIIFRK